MTIDVTGPGGISISFPDGTDPGTIHSVLLQHFGTPSGVASPQAAPAQPISMSALAQQGLEGVPVLGPLANKFNAAVDAASVGATHALGLSTAPSMSDASTFGERYRENLGKTQQESEQFQTQHPIASTAAQIAGGTAVLAPIAGTAMGARLLGLTATTLPGQIAAGAASGAGLNAADALVRGTDPTSGAAIGGIVGGAVPVVGRAAAAIAQPVVNTIRGIANPAEEAARRVAGAVQRDTVSGTAGLDPATWQAAQAGGAPVSIMDVGGETTRALARSAGNTSPEGRAILNKAIDDRFEGQSGRLTDWLNSTFNYPDAFAQQQAIDNLERTTNRAAYQRAYDAGSGGVWSPDLERLTSAPAVVDAMQGAVQRGANRAVASGLGGFNPGVTFDNGIMNFRKGPTGAPVYPDLQFWDLTQRNLRDASQAAYRQGRNEEGSSLAALHGQLLSQLDAAVPEFATARAGASRFFGAENALEAGQIFASPAARLSNPQARLAVAQFSPEERQLFQDGFVSRYIQQLNETGDRRNVVLQIGQSPAARERLDIALGPQRSAELQAMLHVENVMDMARGAVQGNSTTARQLAELGLAGGAGTLLGGGNPLDPASIINATLAYGALKGRTAIDTRVARQVAQMLTSRDPQVLANGMRILGRSQNLLGALRNGDTALARAGAAQANIGQSASQGGSSPPRLAAPPMARQLPPPNALPSVPVRSGP